MSCFSSLLIITTKPVLDRGLPYEPWIRRRIGDGQETRDRPAPVKCGEISMVGLEGVLAAGTGPCTQCKKVEA
jgi:hypothetical protein